MGEAGRQAGRWALGRQMGSEGQVGSEEELGGAAGTRRHAINELHGDSGLRRAGELRQPSAQAAQARADALQRAVLARRCCGGAQRRRLHQPLRLRAGQRGRRLSSAGHMACLWEHLPAAARPPLHPPWSSSHLLRRELEVESAGGSAGLRGAAGRQVQRRRGQAVGHQLLAGRGQRRHGAGRGLDAVGAAGAAARRGGAARRGSAVQLQGPGGRLAPRAGGEYARQQGRRSGGHGRLRGVGGGGVGGVEGRGLVAGRGGARVGQQRPAGRMRLRAVRSAQRRGLSGDGRHQRRVARRGAAPRLGVCMKVGRGEWEVRGEEQGQGAGRAASGSPGQTRPAPIDALSLMLNAGL